jgi:hypothetical protein
MDFSRFIERKLHSLATKKLHCSSEVGKSNVFNSLATSTHCRKSMIWYRLTRRRRRQSMFSRLRVPEDRPVVRQRPRLAKVGRAHFTAIPLEALTLISPMQHPVDWAVSGRSLRFSRVPGLPITLGISEIGQGDPRTPRCRLDDLDGNSRVAAARCYSVWLPARPRMACPLTDIHPASLARAAASPREPAPSLPRIAETW